MCWLVEEKLAGCTSSALTVAARAGAPAVSVATEMEMRTTCRGTPPPIYRLPAPIFSYSLRSLILFLPNSRRTTTMSRSSRRNARGDCHGVASGRQLDPGGTLILGQATDLHQPPRNLRIISMYKILTFSFKLLHCDLWYIRGIG